MKIGQTVGHYRIVAKLGEGGMGVVYRAHDQHLERDVALKVLPPGSLGDAAARRRFRREALALSRLNHPNIGTIHDFDSRDEIDFLVMEHVAGPTLDRRLENGPIPEHEILAIGRQIAGALEEAHERGVIHRDLKPANVALTERGHVKLLDFGLAQLLRREETVGERSTRVTEDPGGLAGTLPYMAPEQLRGESVDARTDLYALGVLLYEMATGHLPFRATLAPMLTDAILHAQPSAATDENRALSGPLGSIIHRLLDKDPSARFQSARELRLALESIGNAERAPAVQSTTGWTLVVVLAVVLVALVGIVYTTRHDDRRADPTEDAAVATSPAADDGLLKLAVLPWKELSDDPATAYFAKGIAESLIGELAQIRALRVISLQHVPAGESPRELAWRLGADVALEGSVLRTDGRVQIMPRLVRPGDELEWAENSEGAVADLIELQRDVARAIVGHVKVIVTPAEQRRLGRPSSIPHEAYFVYDEGRAQVRQRDPNSLYKGLQRFEEAVRIEPTYSLAHAGIADARSLLASSPYDFLAPKLAMPAAAAAAKRAVEIDPESAEAHASEAHIAMIWGWDWHAAEAGFERAIALNPSYRLAHHWYAHLHWSRGDLDAARVEIELAQAVDPRSPVTRVAVGRHYYYAGDYARAIAEFQSALELEPRFAVAHLMIGMTQLRLGDAAAAVEIFRGLTASAPGVPIFESALGYALAATGDDAAAAEVLAELAATADQRHVPATYMAAVAVALSDHDAAFTWLERAYQQRADSLTFLQVEPIFAPLADDPRFADLVGRMGLGR